MSTAKLLLSCASLSDRYYPQTQGDKRTIKTNKSHSSDKWTYIIAHDWDWYEYVRKWNPKKIEKLFKLTPEKLRQIYDGLAVAQATRDPIEKWYMLTQFMSVDERLKLKGDALFAETLRSAAYMIRLFYKDLYDEELSHPNEVTSTVFKLIPEQEVRNDPRRYLEFVVNRYKLNPQPTLTLFVEGQSEETAASIIFEEYFGAHHGTFGIEIINLWGVDAAAGNKEDKFRAILRLVDYLHHHQTHTFLILDNENYAKRLKEQASKSKSIHLKKRFVTRPDYIKIWSSSFEFDNFSCTEISAAMNELAKDYATFTRSEAIDCKKQPNPVKSLSSLYEEKQTMD